MLHSRPTTVQNPPLIAKDAKSNHSMDYNHNSHATPHKPLPPHLLKVVQKQPPITYHYSFNHNAAKAKPLYKVRAPAPARQNSKVCEPNYSSYSRKRKQPWNKCQSFKTNRQST